jgi:hypothetical protein
MAHTFVLYRNLNVMKNVNISVEHILKLAYFIT